MTNLSLSDFLILSPLLAMLLLMFVLLGSDMFMKNGRRSTLLWITSGGMVLIGVGIIIFMNSLSSLPQGWGGLISIDTASLSMMALICIGTAVSAVFASDDERLQQHGEFSFLLVAAAFGLSLMTVSTNLVMLYLAMEMAGIPLYVLAGFLIYDRFSTEAGLKYLLYGAVSSAIMLYGFSMLFGMTETTSFTGIAAVLKTGNISTLTVLVNFLFIMVGFIYKIAAVPFHFWAPDVYTGAPSAVSGFLSTVSKTAGFVVLIRFLTLFFPTMAQPISLGIAVIAVLSMLLGNLLAMQQKNVKRLLAYSSIAHAGYLLVAVAAGNAMSTTGIFYYLTGYVFSNLAAFALVNTASKISGSEDLASFSGLSRKHPGLSFMFLVTFLSLAGIPPLVGFAGKLFVFLPAANPGLNWLVVIGVLNSVLALYYYLNVLKVIYARPEEEGLVSKEPPAHGKLYGIALILCILAILFFGIIYQPWYNVLVEAGRLLWS